MKILLTGANGLLGQKLVSLIVERGEHELVATGKGLNRNPAYNGAYDYATLNVADEASVKQVFDQYEPDVVIHTAAMTNVDQCEDDRNGCWQLNVEAVAYLVHACEVHHSFLIHLSTDFIFDGADGPYDENATPNPISYYGESKLASERLLEESTIQWSIVRTVLVYGIAHDMSRSNIILWVKKSLEDEKEINVVNDQWRTPTLAEDLAVGCYLIAIKKAQGIFNISGKDFLTPYEMAVKTADYFKLDKSFLHETDGSRFSQRAKRPPRTGFHIDKARTILGYEPHSFEEGVGLLHIQLLDRQ